MQKSIFLILISIFLFSCNSNSKMDELSIKINEIINEKDATFGIGIYDFENKQSLFINGDQQFVMMSVVKFPQAIALLKKVDEGKYSIDEKIDFSKNDLRPTYSPILEENRNVPFELIIDEALSYAVSKSDNNVCDRIFKLLGGPKSVEKSIKESRFRSITVGTDYANMHENTRYANQISPRDMTALFYKFYKGELLSETSRNILWQKLVETSTGPDRLKGLLPEGIIVGHKTGTSDTSEEGVTFAFNDSGIMELPNGKSIAIIVFIKDSKLDWETNSRVIAEIAKSCLEVYCEK